eukprot:TRINITY_DN1924_c0_g1_i1.p1 TRINITY_DN1924_c0_g1~~TRINITY_DN1924_c0_g1_i1.p1  ORF type:complete len:259 (+),score=68.84 TRINITY_DN1924_c0_g1_i1:168-944(+)
MSQQPYQYHADLVGTYDNEVGFFHSVANGLGLARAVSMDMNNDPRFFSGNIVDKRLAAFGSLSIVSGLMLGTSMKQCLKLDKDFDMSLEWPFIGWFQLCGFIMQMTVTALCLISLYVIAHQLFYTYRLMTSGPTGFECACVFYLNKYIVMWRHFSIKCLLNGLWLFITSSGFQLFGKFYVDALATHHPPKKRLDMTTHAIMATVVLVLFVLLAIFLCRIRVHHLEAFKEQYQNIKGEVRPISETMHVMAHRGSLDLET